MCKGFNRVVVIVDDIPVYGHTKEDYNRNLFVKVPLEWSPAQLQEESCSTEVSYFGHCLKMEGVIPDPPKITNIKKMEPPKNRAKLETVLGMVNYFAKFSPCLYDIQCNSDNCCPPSIIFHTKCTKDGVYTHCSFELFV